MRKLGYLVGVALSLTSAPALAGAGVGGSIGLLYMQDGSTTKADNSSTSVTRSDIDALIGYVLDNRVMLGLQYVSTTLSSSSTLTFANSSTSANAVNAISGFGPAIGWSAKDGIALSAAYLLGPTDTTTAGGNNSSTTTTLSGGNGYVIDVGYFFKLSSVEFGPALSYRSLSFTKSSTSGVDDPTFKGFTLTGMTPLFVIGVSP